MPRFILVLIALFCFATPAVAASRPVADPESKVYKRAFDAIAANNPLEAENMIERAHDTLLNKILSGYAMALPGNDYSFAQMDAFMRENPVWPGLKAIQMIAEQKLPVSWTSSQTVSWFSAHPPVTLAGFYRYADALNESGQGQTLRDAIRARWINGEFTGDDLTAFYNRYGTLLDSDAVWARMDRLLWKNDAAGAHRIMPMLNASGQSLAQARLALAAQDGYADQWLSRVPSSLQDDPGLQYQKLRWFVKNNRDEDADDVALHPPSDTNNAEAWWEQTQIMIRRAIERHDFSTAYRLSSEYSASHGQTEPKILVSSEFLCGWIALRFLDKPDTALPHFQSLYDSASTPVSRARGAYWLGRTYEALGDKNAAEQAYEDGAALNTTYYGQLATTRIYASPALTAKADPPLPDTVRRSLMARDNIRAILRLSDIGQDEHARAFFHNAVDNATERAEFVILTEIALRMHRPDLGIQTVKAAAQKNMLVENGGFPLLLAHPPSPPEPAFTHALIRQESQFNPDAESGVGARGLMQLMPRTARDTAAHIGIRYKESLLGEPSYNVKLGTAFVQEQIDHFNGSYVLALAGYNAGAGRVHEWLTTYGDPRNPDIDPVDWVELIPISETRSYVQRIIENLQIYRAKLAGGRAPLLILNDLKR